MASTYTIEDHITHKSIKYHLSKSANVAFWMVVFASLVQVFVLWILVGGGETFLGIQLQDEPLPVVEYWPFILMVIVLGEILTVYLLGWTMIAERSLEFGVDGLIYTGTLWGMRKNKTYQLMDVDGFSINETSNKGNDFYSLALAIGNKTLSISPSLSKDDAQALVDLLTEFKRKHI